MYSRCYCINQEPTFYYPISSKNCSGQTIQQISQTVITSNSSDVLCQNVKLYGYYWTIHGTQQSGTGLCGQLSYSKPDYPDTQIYYCINTPNNVITGITNQLNKSSGQAVNICGANIRNYLNMQNLSSINPWSTAAFVILSSFAQALSNQTGYPYGTSTTC